MTAVYPGSFDPMTYGHLDIMERASDCSDKLYIAVLKNRNKDFLFSAEERVDLIKENVKHLDNVEVVQFDGLLADFARQNSVKAIIRGIRTEADFNYEFKMALANRELKKDTETIFIIASAEYLYLSSTIVKEIAYFGGDIGTMVPENVRKSICRKFKE